MFQQWNCSDFARNEWNPREIWRGRYTQRTACACQWRSGGALLYTECRSANYWQLSSGGSVCERLLQHPHTVIICFNKAFAPVSRSSVYIINRSREGTKQVVATVDSCTNLYCPCRHPFSTRILIVYIPHTALWQPGGSMAIWTGMSWSLWHWTLFIMNDNII